MQLGATPIRSIEPVITARLRQAFDEKTFQLQRVPSVMTVKEFERVTRLTPFLGLAWMGIRPDPKSGRQLMAWSQWRLILIAKASSSLDARFKGDTRDIGLDAMVDVACLVLQGAVFDGIGDVTVTRAESTYAEGFADEATVAAQVDFEVRFTATPASLKLVEPDDFEALGITWALRPPYTGNDHGPDTTQVVTVQAP